MKNPPSHSDVLSWCASSGSSVWYPSVSAAQEGISRDELYESTFDLVKLGFIEVVDWSQGKGQGFTLTELGRSKIGAPIPPPVAEVTIRPGNSETAFERGERVRQAFLDPPASMVGQSLVLSCALWFVLGIFFAWKADAVPSYLASGHEPTQLRLGAVNGYSLQRGETWRLLTANLVHNSLLNLLLNLLLLFIVSGPAEALWGRQRYALILLASGLAGMMGSMAVRPEALVGGMTDALAGAVASLGIAAWLYRSHLPEHWEQNFVRTFGVSLFAIVVLVTAPGADWFRVFFGGGIGAIVTMLVFMVQSLNVRNRLIAVVIMMLGVAILATGFRWWTRTNSTWTPIRLWGDVHRQLKELAPEQADQLAMNHAAGTVPIGRLKTLIETGTFAANTNNRKPMERVLLMASSIHSDANVMIKAYEAIERTPEREKIVSLSLAYFRDVIHFTDAVDRIAKGPINPNDWTELRTPFDKLKSQFDALILTKSE